MYFISRNNKKEGPLSLEEVKKLTLTEDILVWKEGMSNWVNIKEIPELKDLVIIAPPPLPSEIKEEEDKEFKKFKYEKGQKIIIRNFLIGLPLGLILAANHYYQATHSAGEQIDNMFPIYLTREERDSPFLIFWHILPYTLLVGQIIMLLISGLQIYRIKPKLNETDSNSTNDIKYQKSDAKILTTNQEHYIKDYKNKIIYKLHNGVKVESIYIQEFLQSDKSILDVEIRNDTVTYGSRAWSNGNLAKDGIYNISSKLVKIENGILVKNELQEN